MFDRFDVCEAYMCLAHDYGLYGMVDRLRLMGFKARPSLTTNTLTENARDIYERHEARARLTGPRDRKLANA